MEAFPIWIIALDYGLGAIMWTLIGRAAMSLFLPENSDFFFMRFFVRATDPLLKYAAPITPQFLIPPFIHVSLLRHAMGSRLFGYGDVVFSP